MCDRNPSFYNSVLADIEELRPVCLTEVLKQYKLVPKYASMLAGLYAYCEENCLQYQAGYNDCGETEYAMSDYSKYETKGRYGILNRITGEPITPAIYSDINMLSKNLFEVQEYDSYDWYLLDTKGNVVSKK